jgi:ribosome-binding protein aMBF1 (putative translation factor)
METNKERFLKLVSPEKCDTVKRMKERVKNRAMYKASQRIALKVLMKLEELDMSKEELAKEMKVSIKIVNGIVTGQQNLSLKTIVKLEKVLNIKLLV